MKVVSELGSADKWEENPIGDKIFNILNVFYVPRSVLGTEGIQQGREGPHLWSSSGCRDVIPIAPFLNLRSALG